MKEKTRDLTPPYARFLSPLVRPFPDFDFSFIKPVRKKAIASVGARTARPLCSAVVSAAVLTASRRQIKERGRDAPATASGTLALQYKI
jgi:hypothetical protein